MYDDYYSDSDSDGFEMSAPSDPVFTASSFNEGTLSSVDSTDAGIKRDHGKKRSSCHSVPPVVKQTLQRQNLSTHLASMSGQNQPVGRGRARFFKQPNTSKFTDKSKALSSETWDTNGLSYDREEIAGSYGETFPQGFGYGPDDGEGDGASVAMPEHKPRILLMGLRRSGKSSIQKVVFHKVSPNETLFLESTSKIVKEDFTNCSFVVFQIWDLPGHLDYFDSTAFDSEKIFGGCGALIFVIDAQDDYMDALTKLHQTVSKAYKINPNIKFEVFIHKVDCLSDDHKIEAQGDVHQRATDDLVDAGLENLHLSFYLTSIYDHSIFEAFSKVVQKLIPQLPTLENLLDIFISSSGIQKAFLFDVVSKIYIATDSSPVDMQSYELCCDMIDVVIDISCIYGDDGDCTYPPDRSKDDGAFNRESSAVIKLNQTVMYLRGVTKYLSLVCLLREDSFKKQGLIDYNFLCFQQAIQEVFELRKKKKVMNGDGAVNGIPEIEDVPKG